MAFECSITGEPITGLAYLLKSTEGEKVVSPEALFSGDAAPKEKSHEDDQGQQIEELKARIEALEAAATAPAGGESAPQTLTASSTSARKATAAKKSTSSTKG